MKVVYTAGALADLQEIFDYQTIHWPLLRQKFEARLSATEQQLMSFPHIAPQVSRFPGIRVVFLTGFPYQIFYRVESERIEILYIHHTSRQPWYER